VIGRANIVAQTSTALVELLAVSDKSASVAPWFGIGPVEYQRRIVLSAALWPPSSQRRATVPSRPCRAVVSCTTASFLHDAAGPLLLQSRQWSCIFVAENGVSMCGVPFISN